MHPAPSPPPPPTPYGSRAVFCPCCCSRLREHTVLFLDQKASNAGTLSADGAAPGASPPGNNGGGNGSSDGDGLASSDIRSDSSSSSSEAHAGASGHEPVVGVGHAALAGGGADVGLDLCAVASPAQTPVGEQQAAAAGALGNFDSSCSGQESPLAMRGRHEQQQAASAPAVARGEEMREGRLKGGNRHDGAGDDAEAKAESKAKDEDGVSYIAGVTEVSNVDEDALASGAIAPASPASERPQGGVVVAAPTPAAAAAGGIAIAMVMRDNVAGGDSKSVESWIKSGGPASASASSQPATPLSAVDSVETIIDALPPGFVKCPGCPMVSWGHSLFYVCDALWLPLRPFPRVSLEHGSLIVSGDLPST